jgi:hypothetical protein
MTPKTILKTALASAALVFGTPAMAADLDYDVDGGGASSVVISVHNRGYRHCHWIDGDRVCGRRGVPYASYYDDYDDYGYDDGYGYGYGYGPGVVLGFGGGYGYGGRGYGYGGHRGGHGGYGGGHGGRGHGGMGHVGGGGGMGHGGGGRH